jgi:hypothetical protein
MCIPKNKMKILTPKCDWCDPGTQLKGVSISPIKYFNYTLFSTNGLATCLFQINLPSCNVLWSFVINDIDMLKRIVPDFFRERKILLQSQMNAIISAKIKGFLIKHAT